MTDGAFFQRIHDWFHPSQVVDGGVLWNPGDDVLPWIDVELQYLWYKKIGEWLQPKTFLEVGVGYGYSTLSLLSGVTNVFDIGIVWVENESQWESGIAQAYVSINQSYRLDSGPVWVKSWEELSLFKGKCFKGGQSYDLIHIDANHEYEHVTRDAFESFNYAQKGAHWLFHDSEDPPVAKAAEEFAEWNKLKWFKIPEVRCGLHVVHSCEEGECPILKGMAEMNG